MQLKDTANMEKYLEEDCYCPGEIYDVSGFFFQVFKVDEECRLLTYGKSKDSDNTITCVVCKDQIINFWINPNNEIVAAERYDATKNNIKQMVDYWNGNSEKINLDEFKNGETAKSLAEIMKYADAICVS